MREGEKQHGSGKYDQGQYPAAVGWLCCTSGLRKPVSVFFGTPFAYFYNVLAAALKSVGDVCTQLRFLMHLLMLNIMLDLLYIGLLRFDIVCSTVMTAVVEVVSAVLSIGYIYRRVNMLQMRRYEWRIDRLMLRRML